MDFAKEEDENEVKQLAETLETVSRNEGVATMDEGLEKKNPLNPMMLRLVIRCVLKFLKLEDIKNCRLTCREWGSTGEQALANRTRIIFHKCVVPYRVPEDFQDCFLNSAPLFSTFVINGRISDGKVDNYWTIEELTLFFEEQQRYIKELELEVEYADTSILRNVDISSWISKSPMVQKDARYMTKLAIHCYDTVLDIPFVLIAHIKDLNLSLCRINLEEGVRIKMCPIEIRLSAVTFYQNGRTLDRVRINDIADLCKAKDIYLDCKGITTKYLLDLWGTFTLDKLCLYGVETVNGETSQWATDFFRSSSVPYSLNRQMKIKEICITDATAVDLINLPTSVEKFSISTVGETTTVTCSQPIVLENLTSLSLCLTTDYSLLSHFTNCLQLSHVLLDGPPGLGNEMKSVWMPKTVKTLTLANCSINWIDDIYLNLQKLVLYGWSSSHYAKELCNAKIRVDDFAVLSLPFPVNQDFVQFLEYRKRCNFGNRFYVGHVTWEEVQFEESLLKDLVDVQAAFYVFENGEKGRALPQKQFFESEPFRSVQL